MKRQDMTLEQLKQYDGMGEHGRVCVAVNGKIFDVTRGTKFYGPGQVACGSGGWIDCVVVQVGFQKGCN